jgi:release factor glutamine methyltransferase
MTSTEDPWTIGRLLSWTVEYLGKHGADNPRLDAEVLLAEARGCKRIDLYAAYGETASDEVRTAFRELVRRRAEGTPVAYLVGRREFYALDFEVNPDVLIPRPETELLVVALLDYVKTRAVVRGSPDPALPPTEGLPSSTDRSQQIEIADVGTGSGIVAVCAAKYVANSHVTANDLSPAALAVAHRNAERHGVADRITFVEGNILATEPVEPRFDYILSNPPYISNAEMETLARDVRSYEPDIALRAGEKGTDVVAPLIKQSAIRLKPSGALLIEISPMIAGEVEQLIREQPSLDLGATIRDLAGHARIVQATKL